MVLPRTNSFAKDKLILRKARQQKPDEALINAAAEGIEDKCEPINFTLPRSEKENLEKLVGKCQKEFIDRKGGKATDLHRGIVIRAAIKMLIELSDEEIFTRVEVVKKPKEGKQRKL